MVVEAAVRSLGGWKKSKNGGGEENVERGAQYTYFHQQGASHTLLCKVHVRTHLTLVLEIVSVLHFSL